MTDPPPRPMVNVPISGPAPPGQPARHETVLPDEPPEATADLNAALAENGAGGDATLREVAAAHPALLEVWGRLSERALAAGHPVEAYAFARVAYHRGLDRLRKNGWGGTGMVRWSRPGNRGFLRGLHALLAAAAAIDETDESVRCRAFLLELDPDDALGVSAYPEVPGPEWTPPALP